MASESGDHSNEKIEVTCTAPVNIAVVKYWGKRNEELILPINSSLSATLDQDQLCAKTTVCANKKFTKDRMWLNGQEQIQWKSDDIDLTLKWMTSYCVFIAKEQNMDSPRLQNVLKEIRRRARKRKVDENGSDQEEGLCSWHVHIASVNNFPTAAGLASSAAGYACLVYSLAKVFKVEGEISDIARQGSGSACRSIYGGFVSWEMGTEKDGSDSYAKQIVPETHWPEMRVLILVANAMQKHTGSTTGMQTSVETSQLLQHRASTVVPERMVEMTKAIAERDFQKFAELTMKDSNSMHAACLDTYPPIAYMTDTSHDVVRMVHAINKFHGCNKIAYTFDAGPNACLYVLEDDVQMTLGVIRTCFPPMEEDLRFGSSFIRGIRTQPTEPNPELLQTIPLFPSPGAIKYVISTKVGPGPKVVTESTRSLLGADGLPAVTPLI